MTRYHLNSKGSFSLCNARKRACPFEDFEFTPEQKDMINNPSLYQERANEYGKENVRPFIMKLPETIDNIITEIQEEGTPLIVGGAVRDSITGSSNKDIDIEVHGTTIDSLAQFLKNKGYIVDEVGKEFGVLKVSGRGVTDLDVSVPRKENRVGAGHRSFEVVMDTEMTLLEAAERRDFTLNAMMYDHVNHMIIDPSRGLSDLNRRVLRHVSGKFSEDPLRVLRGFQFAARFNLRWAPDTRELAQSIRSEYEHLSTERVQGEWEKFFTKSTKPLNGVIALQESGWDDISPGLKESLSSEMVQKRINEITHLKKDKDIIGSALIARNMNQKDRKDFYSISLIGRDKQDIAEDLAKFKSSDASTTYLRKKLAFELRSRGFTFERLYSYGKVIDDKEIIEVSQKAALEGIYTSYEPDFVMGKDILECSSKKPGPWVGEIISQFREMQYRGNFKTKKEALEILDNFIKKKKYLN